VSDEAIIEIVGEIPPFANQTTRGLAASIWTRDISKALRLAKALNADVLWVNCTMFSIITFHGEASNNRAGTANLP
jgi:acyl-CoA reductase-like NAD-dependent aldehyde dehydrogenase